MGNLRRYAHAGLMRRGGVRWCGGTALPVPASPALWLRADSGVGLSGSDVTSWADVLGGSGISFSQGTAANRPTHVSGDSDFNGNDSILFDGTDDYLDGGDVLDLAASEDMTVYFACRQTLTAVRFLMANRTGGAGYQFGAGNAAFAVEETEFGIVTGKQN